MLMTQLKLTRCLLATVTVFAASTALALPPGFQVTTFAKPPQVTYPTGVAAAPTGEVYVDMDLNSSLDQKPGRGKIVRCVDTDGDGHADQFTDFVPVIDSPRGCCFVGDSLYVVHPPYLSAFRDRDGDGVADEHDVLIKGLGFDLSFRGADHTSNGVRMGIDGWLYLAIGDYGMFHAQAKDGSTMHLHGGGVLRIRPDGSELEPYSLYTRNIYDVGISPTLDVFSRDNTNDGKGWNTRLHHFISLANHGYPRLYKNFPDEHLQPLADYGGGSGTGAYFLDEPGFPEPYNHVLYTCDFTTQKVYLHPMERVEATFRARQKEFYAIKAIDLDVDGSSRMYLSDWTGGQYRYGRPDVGSISRITYPALRQGAFPNLKIARDQDLLDDLASHSAVLRINAQRHLLRRGKKPAVRDGLRRRAADAYSPISGRIAALFTLKQLYGEAANPWIVQLSKRDSSIREFALRALADRKSQLDNVPPSLFVEGLKDENPRVQLQAIIGLARLGNPNPAKWILPLAARPFPISTDYQNNRAIPHIAIKALVKLGAAGPCLEALDDAALQDAALRCLQEMHTEMAVKGLIAKLAATSSDPLKAKILTALFRLYQKEKPWDGTRWWTTRPDDRGPYFEPVTWEWSPRIRSAIEMGFASIPPRFHSELLIQMRRNRIDPSSFHLNTKVDEVLAWLETDHLSSIALDPLKEAALSSHRDIPTRIRAFQALRRIPGSDALRAQLDVLAAWRNMKAGRPEFESARRDFIYSPRHAEKPQILRASLYRSKGYRAQLAFMIALNLINSPLSNADLKKTLGGAIHESFNRPELMKAIGEMGLTTYQNQIQKMANSKNSALAALAQSVAAQLEKLQAPPQGKAVADLDPATAMARVRTAHGDPALGKTLFERQGCIACHTVSKEEPLKGPYLGDAGRKWKRADLIQSILEPNAVIAQGFQTQWFETRDELVYDGFVTAVVDDTVELRTATGLVVKLARDAIVKQGQRTTSTMPEGLVNNLSLDQFASLVDYLQSLRRAGSDPTDQNP